MRSAYTLCLAEPSLAVEVINCGMICLGAVARSLLLLNHSVAMCLSSSDVETFAAQPGTVPTAVANKRLAQCKESSRYVKKVLLGRRKMSLWAMLKQLMECIVKESKSC